MLIYFGCTAWTLRKRLEKKLDGNYTRMLRAILNKSWRQHPTRQQLYGHLPPITKTIQVRQNRHAGHCWRSRDELISDELLRTPIHGRAKAGRSARIYIQQLCEDTGCCPENLPEAMNDIYLFVSFLTFNGISTFVGYLLPKPSIKKKKTAVLQFKPLLGNKRVPNRKWT